MMSMSNYLNVILPDLTKICSIPLACNSQYQSVSTETEDWLYSYGIPYTESTAKYNLWSGLTFPKSSRTRLRDATDVWTLLFLTDDIMDSCMNSGLNSRSKRNLFQNMNECLQPAGRFKPLTPFAAALHDWWQRIRANSTEAFQKRLIYAYQESNEASLQQLTNRNKRETIPNLQTYIKSRRDTSYGRVVCYFVEYSLDLNIPEQCWSNETFQSLINCATDAAAWTNDVYSFRLEQAKGDYNLVMVLWHQNSLGGIQEAMDEAGRMIIERYNEFEQLQSQLPSWGQEIDEQVKQYLDGLASGIIANAVWSFETPRYFGEAREQIKKTRCVQIVMNKDIFNEMVDETKMIDDENRENSNEQSSMASGEDTDDTDSECSQSQTSSSNDSEKVCQSSQMMGETELTEAILSPYFYLNSLSGKRIRSELIAALNFWFRTSPEKLSVINDVIGMFHNASLMIDDIEDGSPLRRGEPAAHIIYGVPLTINAAELACFLAMQKAMELGDPRVPHIMIKYLVELHKGQGYDIWWRDNQVCPTEEQYEQMVLRKCGGLFSMIVDLIHVSSEVQFTEKQCQSITQLCQQLALLFQIRDDYCNLMSSEYAQKKSFCEDLSEGKYSYVIIHALRTYPDDHRIDTILKQHTQNIDLKRQALQLLYQFGSIKYTRERCFQLSEQCHRLIDELNGNLFLKLIINHLMCTFDLTDEENLADVLLF